MVTVKRPSHRNQHKIDANKPSCGTTKRALLIVSSPYNSTSTSKPCSPQWRSGASLAALSKLWQKSNRANGANLVLNFFTTALGSNRRWPQRLWIDNKQWWCGPTIKCVAMRKTPQWHWQYVALAYPGNAILPPRTDIARNRRIDDRRFWPRVCECGFAGASSLVTASLLRSLCYQ